MKSAKTQLKGRDGSRLNLLSFIPESSLKGVVIILHGMGEHAARYGYFAKFLGKNGYAVYAHDHRGHGHSLNDGQAVGILRKNDTFAAMLEDVDGVYRHVVRAHPGIPVSMFGHSMGSIILRRYLQMFHPDVTAVVLSGTLPRYHSLYTKIMRGLAFSYGLFKRPDKRCHALAKLMNDGLIKKIEGAQTSFDWISSETDIVEAYLADPLCGYAYNKRFYGDFFKTIDAVNQSKNIRKTGLVPILMISGTEDPLSENMTAIEKLANAYQAMLSEASVNVHAVDGARHEIINEKNRLDTYRIILDFIETEACEGMET